MFCTNCGNKLLDGEIFCAECGMKVANDAVPQPAPQPEVAVAPQPEVVVATQPDPQPNVQPAYMQQNVQPAYNQAPIAKQSGGVSVLSIIGFSLSILALILSITCLSEFNSYYGVSEGLVFFTAFLAEAALPLSVVGVVIAARKGQKLKPMGIVGIVLSAVATIFISIILVDILIMMGIY
jgi:hypothetical protein